MVTRLKAVGCQVDVPHVGLDERDCSAGLAQSDCLAAGNVQHARRGVDADDVYARLRDRYGDAAGAAAELQDRASGAPGFIYVEGDVVADVGVD